MVSGTDPEVARIQREIRKKWLITLIISYHSEVIAAVVAAIGTLFMMVNTETGADAVIWLLTLPAPLWLMAKGLIDGLTS
jgi:hypothetical protein